MLKDAIDLTRVKRALVIRLMHHGDVLLTSPVFTVLKNHAPHLEVDALVYHETRDMITLHPAVSEVFTIDRNWKKQGVLSQLQQELKLFSRLKERDYQLVIVLNDSNRATLLVRLLKPRWSVVPDIPGRSRFFRKTFTHRHALVHGNRRHMVQWHLDALRRLGIYPEANEIDLVLEPGDAAREQVAKLMAQHGLSAKSFILVHPGSRWFYKCWPTGHMAQLINMLAARDIKVALTGAPSAEEQAMIQSVKNGVISPIVDLSGQLTLKQLAALIGKARLFVGVDSLPMHLAAAMQTPVVALFGPSRDKVWGPWNVTNRQVKLDWSCRPCNLAGCGGSERSECIENIPVQQVLKAIDELMEETACSNTPN